MADYITAPEEIETRSMEIIASLLSGMEFKEGERQVVYRVVHTTGDKDIAPLIEIHPQAIAAGMEALKKGCTIFTDVNMVAAGISKAKLSPFGGEVVCRIHDAKVKALSKETGLTRAMTAFGQLAEEMNNQVVAIGNAPTALFRLLEAVKQGKATPALIIGTPVGFVGAAESKELLTQQNTIPYITVRGTKGGSPVAAAIVNALLKLTAY